MAHEKSIAPCVDSANSQYFSRMRTGQFLSCPAPPGYCPLAASLPLAGPATAGQGRKPRSGGAVAPALTGWSWSGAIKVAVRSLLPLKNLRGISRISPVSVTMHGCDASEAKAAISKAPSPFALIPKDNLAEATARHVHERLKTLCRNNHIERTDGAPFISPWMVELLRPCAQCLCSRHSNAMPSITLPDKRHAADVRSRREDRAAKLQRSCPSIRLFGQERTRHCIGLTEPKQ